jgi:hypothetical protein
MLGSYQARGAQAHSNVRQTSTAHCADRAVGYGSPLVASIREPRLPATSLRNYPNQLWTSAISHRCTAIRAEPDMPYTEWMVSVVCSCPRDNRCPACVDQALMWLGGMACTRGITWAEDVAKRHPELHRREWPPHHGRAAELARAKVEDLFEDPHVVDLLAVEVSKQAARRWRQLQVERR